MMHALKVKIFRVSLMSASVAAIAISAATPAMAQAQVRDFDIPAQPLSSALLEFSRQSDVLVVVAPELTEGKRSQAVRASLPANEAVARLLRGTGLRAVPNPRGGYRIERQTASSNKNPAEAASTSGEGKAAGAAINSADGGEEIVVTGTLIEGTKQASPLIVLSRADIERSGQGTVERYLETLPQNFSGGASQDTRDSTSDSRALSNRNFGSTVSLRGLGAGTTLVLLNNRRIAAAGNLGAFSDVSMIPLSAIERVEVLTDGASALYGSDAVGGVVNFILRDNYRGAELNLRSGITDDGKAAEISASPSLGVSWNGGGILAAYEHYQQRQLNARDRSFSGDAAGTNATLLPSQDRSTFFLSAQHQLTSALEFNGMLMHSERDAVGQLFRAGRFDAGFVSTSTRQQNAQAGLTYQVANGWKLDLSYAESRQREAFDSQPQPVNAVLGRSRSRLRSYYGLVRGELFSLPGGKVRLAVGGEHRDESFFRSTLNRGNTTNFAGDRNVDSIFGEIYLPLADRPFGTDFLSDLSLSVAGRYDNYSDFGSSFVPKFGTRATLFDGFAIRSTFSQSFRAPLLSDLLSGYSLSAFAVPDPTNLSGNGTGQAIALFRSGGIQLREERADSWTIGFDWRSPDNRITASATAYFIDYRGKITTPTNNNFDYLNFPEIFSPVIQANPPGSLVSGLISGATSFQNFAGPNFTPLTPFDPAVVDFLIQQGQQNIGRDAKTGSTLA